MHRICWNYIHQREELRKKNSGEEYLFMFRARKYSKWWSQCFLTGIEQILLGFRDDYGVVRQIQPLLVKDIETRAVRSFFSIEFFECFSLIQRTWSSSSFLSFLNEFCAFVRKTITKDYFEDEKLVFDRLLIMFIYSLRFLERSISSIFLRKRKKLNGVQQLKGSINFYPNGFLHKIFHYQKSRYHRNTKK
jgi:hypothetical protein